MHPQNSGYNQHLQIEFELASDLGRMNVAKGLYKGQNPEMVSVEIRDSKGPLLVKAKNR
jgi:hypothetical protein